ncbi:MAG: Do family serine endopeptidase [bacterium]|nr:Do family serine endopeptidase [bacterium]
MVEKRKNWLQILGLSLVLVLSGEDIQAHDGGFADVVAPLLPGVVNISTTREVKTPKGPAIPPGSPFEDLFRQFFEGQGREPRARKVRSLGSGFVIDSSGYIVTNNHVVADAQEVLVTFHGQEDEETELKAKIVGRDPRTDLALLKVESKKPLVALKWGDSTKSRVGDWVIAIGNPFGLGSTVTSGIISNIGRDVTMGPAQYIEGFLQIDAPVNQGNSGGPAFNAKGEVIGVINAIATTTGGNIGIGFAIPSEVAISTIAQLKKFGRTRRGRLGVGVLPVDKEKAEYYGLVKAYGAEVNEVNEKGPADRAGIKDGDIILEFNGQKIKSSRHLPRVVGETPIGVKVPVVVWRDGKRVSLSVDVGDYEEAEKAASGEESEEADEIDDDGGDVIKELGVTLHPLNLSARERYRISDEVQGVVIIGMDMEGVAAAKGIRRGDVITSVDGSNLSSIKELRSAIDLSKKEGKKLMRWRISRQGRNLFFVLPTDPEGDDEDEGESEA